jgi:hypothetical protein
MPRLRKSRSRSKKSDPRSKKRDPRSKKEVRSKKVIQGQKKTCPTRWTVGARAARSCKMRCPDTVVLLTNIE